MDVIDRHECYDLTREGRFLIARLQTPHQVLSTSACNGGLCNDIRYLVNHQSCEGKGHDARFALLKLAPIFYYALLGLPGLVLFKVISTMDSMVGFKTPRYRCFGWCGARLDDVLNFLPARLTYVLMIVVAFLLPHCSARKALVVGWQQHALVPGPNSGWSEATAAGALQRRLVGPIWQDGMQITDLWLGDANDPEGGRPEDMRRMCVFVVVTCLLSVGLAAVYLAYVR